MKYLGDSPFSVGLGSRAYRENFDRIFGQRESEELDAPTRDDEEDTIIDDEPTLVYGEERKK